MDIEFENKFYANDKMGKEYVNKILTKNARRIILVFILICLFILKNGILKRNLSKIYWMIACIVILLLLNFYNQKYFFRLIKKRSMIIHNDQTYPTLVQFGNSISMKEGKFSIDIDYSKII
ncbi:YcxB family protein, partial [Fusobacterium nucleatum]|uniref:YcxB family protein n=2 Tax=Fusobacterium TaxID=848 RepID=UPI001F516D8B